MEGLGRFVFASVLGLGRALWSALVLQSLWLWFIVPLGAVHLRYWHAYGMMVVIGFVAVRVVRIREDERAPSLTRIVAIGIVKAVFEAFSLGVGAAVHAWGMAS